MRFMVVSPYNIMLPVSPLSVRAAGGDEDKEASAGWSG
jgi:hypothetical protein